MRRLIGIIRAVGGDKESGNWLEVYSYATAARESMIRKQEVSRVVGVRRKVLG